MTVAKPFLLSPEHGAAPIVHLATSPDVAELNGTYWSGMHQPEVHPTPSTTRMRAVCGN